MMKKPVTKIGWSGWWKMSMTFFFCFMLLLPMRSFAITYSYESIDDRKCAFGINDNGDIIVDQYLLTGGSFYYIDPYPMAAAHDINNSNNIVGFYANPEEYGYSGVYDTASSTYTTLDSFRYEHPTLGSRSTYAFGINETGWVVGMCRYPKNIGDNVAQSHAFLFKNGSFEIIDYPGYDAASAKGINDLNQIVGQYYNADDSMWEGFLLDYDTNSYSSIIFSGSTETVLYDINNDGWIVGYYTDSSDLRHGFVRIDGVFTEISFPDAYITIPWGINSDGWIVGEYWKDQVQHAFLAKPVSESVPEPTTILFFGFGLIGLAGLRWKA